MLYLIKAHIVQSVHGISKLLSCLYKMSPPKQWCDYCWIGI